MQVEVLLSGPIESFPGFCRVSTCFDTFAAGLVVVSHFFGNGPPIRQHLGSEWESAGLV